jgi:hypothetical protein
MSKSPSAAAPADPLVRVGMHLMETMYKHLPYLSTETLAPLPNHAWSMKGVETLLQDMSEAGASLSRCTPLEFLQKVIVAYETRELHWKKGYMEEQNEGPKIAGEAAADLALAPLQRRIIARMAASAKPLPQVENLPAMRLADLAGALKADVPSVLHALAAEGLERFVEQVLETSSAAGPGQASPPVLGSLGVSGGMPGGFLITLENPRMCQLVLEAKVKAVRTVFPGLTPAPAVQEVESPSI